MQHLDEGTLQAWLDGARSGLDPSRLATIGRHLASCEACASLADSLARSSFRAHGLLAVGRVQYAPRVPYEDVAKRAHDARPLEGSRRRRIAATWAASIVGALAVGWMSNDLDLFAVSAPPTVPATEAASAPAAAPSTLLADAGPPGLAASPSTSDVVSQRTDPSPAASDAVADAAPVREAVGLVVRGLVEDEGGRPIPAAQVYVAELAVSVLTRQDGRYDLRLPAEAASFELTVERIGFRQQARAVSGREGDYVEADFRLREEALALDEIVVTGESDEPQRRYGGNTRATPWVWRPLSSIAAEGYVGSELWTLPGLDVLTLEVALGNNPNEMYVARVRQRLGDGTAMTFIQGRTDGRRTRWPIQSAGAVLSTWRGEMLITATAPVSADSLRTLLTQLR